METKKRIRSVDLLRGVAIAAMILVNTPGSWEYVYPPLLHASWHGLTPTDLIFPFFLFIVGISIFFAYQHKPNNRAAYKKIGVRALKLIALGIFLNWFLPYIPFLKDFDTLRLPGVLQRIGVVFLISAILFLNVSRKMLVIIALIILILYWIFLGFVPFPDGTLPAFERASNNWALHIDSQLLGAHMWKPDYDPEGLVSTFPAIVSCISGILIGTILGSDRPKKTFLLASAGMLLLAIGYLWSIWFPLNKALWSSSFVLVTSGWATLILTLIYYLTDVKKLKFGSVFIHVGMNAIVIYFLSSFITKIFYLVNISESQTIHGWLYQTFFTSMMGENKIASLLYAVTVTGCYVLLAYILYRKKIFIKV